jgi:hypothetical protein
MYSGGMGLSIFGLLKLGGGECFLDIMLLGGYV